MSTSKNETSKLTPKTFVDSIIRVGLAALLALACFRVASPFIGILIWALIFAIMLYPWHQRIAARLGGRPGWAAALMVVVACVLIDPPLVLLSASFVEHVRDLEAVYESGESILPAPDPRVAEWPIVGEQVFGAWREAAANLPEFARAHAAQLQTFAVTVVGAAGDAIGAVLLFFASFVIAGIMMAFGEPGSRAMDRIYRRVVGPTVGPELLSLTVGTVRSVALGVLGVAFVQALLFGVGFVLADVPAAGVLALVVMFIGIIQVPAAVVAVPVIAYMWAAGDGSVTSNLVFTVYFVIAGLSDNVLKPLLLGRGVDAPMPVILIGALGGLITGGFIGLFLGSILLALGYRIFMRWVDGAGGQAEHALAHSGRAAQE